MTNAGTLRFILIIAICLTTASRAYSNDLYWSFSRGEQQLYVLGSVHLASEEFYPLPEIITQHLKSSDALVLEIADIENPDIARYTNQISFLPDGKLLMDGWQLSTIEKAQRLGDEMGVPLSAMQHRKPWFYVIVMTSMKIMQLGYSPELGIDLHMLNLAKQNNLPVLGLETGRQQLDMMNGLTFDESRVLASLEEIEHGEEVFGELMDTWLGGDLQRMDQLINQSFADSPDIQKAMLDDRNLNWISVLEQHLAQQSTLFVVVGAGHLSGANGLVNLLQKKGFEASNPLK